MASTKEKIVIDLETQKSFTEVGRNNLDKLKVSVAGIYSYLEDKFLLFEEKDLSQLLPYLRRAELVIGFNLKKFDYPVLQPYADFDLQSLPTLDMLEEVHQRLGFRLSLDSIAKASLNVGKNGSGLDALRFFKEGNIKKLCEYCQHDVLITKDVYEFGKLYGHLRYHTRHSLETIPIGWSDSKSIPDILEEAFNERKRIKVEYSSPVVQSGKTHTREIDIYALDLGKIIGFCHLRKAMRTFNIRRVLSAKIKDDTYTIPADFDLQSYKARQKF